MNKAIFLLSVLFVIVFTGCTTRLGDFTILSTRNIEFSKFPTYVRGRERVKGEDIAHIIVMIPTKMSITIEDAVDQALDSVPGAVALVDAVIRAKQIYVILYGQVGYIVEGTALIDPEYATADSFEPRVVYFNEDGEMISEKLTMEEFSELQESAN